MNKKNVPDSGITAIQVEDDMQEAPYRKRANGFSQYESLEYYYTGNQIIDKDKIRVETNPKFIFILTLFININIGIITGIFGTLLYSAISKLLDVKFSIIRKAIRKYGTTKYMYIPILCFVSINSVPVIVSSILITYVEPLAAGAGVRVIRGYLNGLNLKEGLKLKAILVKCVAVVLGNAGGIPGSSEGAMVQTGAVMGAQICDFITAHPLKSCEVTKYFRHEFYRKEFIWAGIASGVSCALLAPIAGTILPLEETTSYWSLGLSIKILMSSTASAFISTALKTFLLKGNFYNGVYNIKGIETIEYRFFEIPIFVLMGIFGGLVGSLWNEINFRLNSCRLRRSKWMKVLETGSFMILYSTIAYFVVYLVGDCVVEEPEFKMLHCAEGKKSTMEKFFFEPSGKLFRDLLYLKERGEPRFRDLVTFFLIYFTGTSIASGMSVTMGNLMPTLLVGAVWGRCIGEVGKKYIPNAPFINPGKYALIGAAAQLAGIMQLTISLTLILVEITGMTPEFILPLIVVIVCAKWTGVFIIGDRHTRRNKLPILPWKLPACAINRKVEEIMNKPAVCFLIQEKASYVYEVLKNTTHNGYPIVQGDRSNGLLFGLILRENLFVVLQERFFEERKNDWLEDVASVFLSSKYDNRDLFDIQMPPPEEANFTIDMTLFMGPYPIPVISKAYVPEIYGLFRSLGFRRIVITDDKNKVVGVVTRKDFFCEP